MAVLSAVVVWGMPASVDAQEAAQGPAAEKEQEVDEPIPIHEQTGVFGGVLLNSLFATEDPLVFRYFDLGFRHKRGEYHFEFRAPALTVIGDGLFTLLTMPFRDFPELLMMTMNSSDLLSHWELGHARLGYRFLLVPPGDFELWTDPIETAVGFFGTADLVFFEFHRQMDGENLDQAQNYGYLGDPLVLGAGAYAALGRTYDDLQFEIAFAVGQAIRGIEANPERRITIGMVDADIQYDPGIGPFTIYMRPRLTGYYTRLDPALMMAGGFSTGVTLGF